MLRLPCVDSNKRLWIYAGLALAAGVGLVSSSSSPGPTQAPKPLRKLGPGERILLLGDSIAQGLAVPMKQLAISGGVAFASDGRVGTRISQWASQPWLTQDAKAFLPTLVLLSIGTNDMLLPDPSTEMSALAKLVSDMKQGSSQVVLIAPPTMKFPDRGVRSMLQSTGLPIFPSDSLSIPRAPDGIHPTPAGYAGMAAQIWKWLGGGGSQAISGLPAGPYRRIGSRRSRR